MAQHPVRKLLLARKHPDGLQGARKEFAALVGCHPDSLRNIDSAYHNPGTSLAKSIEKGAWNWVDNYGINPKLARRCNAAALAFYEGDKSESAA
jgi:hypothetical protein